MTTHALSSVSSAVPPQKPLLPRFGAGAEASAGARWPDDPAVSERMFQLIIGVRNARVFNMHNDGYVAYATAKCIALLAGETEARARALRFRCFRVALLFFLRMVFLKCMKRAARERSIARTQVARAFSKQRYKIVWDHFLYDGAPHVARWERDLAEGALSSPRTTPADVRADIDASMCARADGNWWRAVARVATERALAGSTTDEPMTMADKLMTCVDFY